MRNRIFLLLLALGILMAARPPLLGAAGDETRISAEQLEEAIASANPHDTIIVDGGVHHGPLVIDKSITLIGENWPEIDGGNTGTVVQVNAPSTTIQGFVIRNSGHVLDEENAGIAVEAADARIIGNQFEDTLFGIYLREGHGTEIKDNLIKSKDLDLPRRGDPIRVWYSNDVTIHNNEVRSGRDVVLWYSERLDIRDNDVSGGRYGLHFMYSDDATIAYNRLTDNSVGVYLMYSRRLDMHHNTVVNNRGPSGYGVGMKDLDDAIVSDNLFLDNRIGAYLDGSPREVDSIGRFEGNVFGYNDIGMLLAPAVRHNQVSDNSFVENGEQVAMTGGGLLKDNDWTVDGRGNFWSDYAGYDGDGDGLGEIPYRAERLFERLIERDPRMRLFLYSPAVSALEFAARAFPLVKPKPKLQDERPLVAPLIPEGIPALNPQSEGNGWLWVAPLLLTLALVIMLLPVGKRRRYLFGQQPEKQQITHR